MFKKIGPQFAQHESGYSVLVADREHVGYRDSAIEAEIEADFLSGVVPLYCKTLEGKNRGEPFSSASNPDVACTVLQRIEEGLEFLGIRFELVRDYRDWPGLIRLLPLAPGGFHQVLGIPLTFDLNLRRGLFNLGQVDGCQLHVGRREVFIETM